MKMKTPKVLVGKQRTTYIPEPGATPPAFSDSAPAATSSLAAKWNTGQRPNAQASHPLQSLCLQGLLLFSPAHRQRFAFASPTT